MPYRLGTYDAMTSSGVTADTSTKRRSIATPSSVYLRAGWSADPKEDWPVAPSDVLRDASY
jgi:hypothetical protein